MAASEYGPLAELPLRNRDFASACYTAAVKRERLVLIIVRVIVCDTAGTVDANRCRSVGFLYDTGKKAASMREAVLSGVHATKQDHETDQHIREANIYARSPMSTDMLPILVDESNNKTIAEEMTLADGKLKGAVHNGGALRAYRDHCTAKSVVCMRNAVRIYRKIETWTVPDTVSLAKKGLIDMYIAGLRILTGAGNPTTKIPEDVQCDTRSDCNCFMHRSMYRGGSRWMILYAVLPPHSAPPTLPPPLPIIQQAWLQKIVATETGETSVDDSAGGNTVPLDAICPNAWPARPPDDAIILEHGFDAASIDSAFNEDEETSESSSMSSSESLSSESRRSTAPLLHQRSPAGLVETSAVGALVCRKMFRHQLIAAARIIGTYHSPSLRHVIASSRRRTFGTRLMARAREVQERCPNLYQFLRQYQTGVSGINAALISLRLPHQTTLEACELVGYTTAVIVAVIIRMEVLKGVRAVSPARQVNTWNAYVDFESKMMQRITTLKIADTSLYSTDV